MKQEWFRNILIILHTVNQNHHTEFTCGIPTPTVMRNRMIKVNPMTRDGYIGTNDSLACNNDKNI